LFGGRFELLAHVRGVFGVRGAHLDKLTRYAFSHGTGSRPPTDAGQNRSFVFADTDGFWNGQRDANDALSFCYMHTNTTSTVVSCPAAS
jgi:hypothetical protein